MLVGVDAEELLGLERKIGCLCVCVCVLKRKREMDGRGK